MNHSGFYFLLEVHMNQSRIHYTINGKKRCTKKLYFHNKVKVLTENELNQLYDLMKDMVEILHEFKLKYWLSSGTLLGAIRHKGFIPWDDDIDLCYLWQDHATLGRVLQTLCARNPKYIHLDTHSGYMVWLKDTKFHADFFMMGERNNNIIYAGPLSKKTQKPTFFLSEAYPEKCSLKEMFPLKKTTFEDLTVFIPNKSVKICVDLYSDKCLKSVKVSTQNYHFMNTWKKNALKTMFDTTNYFLQNRMTSKIFRITGKKVLSLQYCR